MGNLTVMIIWAVLAVIAVAAAVIIKAPAPQEKVPAIACNASYFPAGTHTLMPMELTDALVEKAMTVHHGYDSEREKFKRMYEFLVREIVRERSTKTGDAK